MAKNTGASQFRKVDVDQFNEDTYQEDVGQEGGMNGPDEQQVTSLLSSGRNIEALQHVLRDPPIAQPKNVRDKAASLVTRVMMSFKGEKNIDDAIGSLDQDSVDILMKYIYRNFAEPADKTSALFLTWHERAFKVGGYGAILRTMTDRRAL